MGALLVQEFECSRCHEGTGMPRADPNKDCRGCHRDILQGKLVAAPDALAGWQARIRHFVDVPSLAFVGKKFRRSWLER